MRSDEPLCFGDYANIGTFIILVGVVLFFLCFIWQVLLLTVVVFGVFTLLAGGVGYIANKLFGLRP